MAKPTTHRRAKVAEKRQLRMAMQLQSAATAIGQLEHGCEIFGLTKGDFSLISILEHCLKRTGPADLVVSTWTAAAVDIEAAEKFLENEQVRTIQFLVDQSFRTRQPEYCTRLIEAFGQKAIRFSRSHCKFATITNDVWALVVRTSMNLNENRRIENFEISEDRTFAEFLLSLRDELFDQPFEYSEENFRAVGSGKGVISQTPFDRLRGLGSLNG